MSKPGESSKGKGVPPRPTVPVPRITATSRALSTSPARRHTRSPAVSSSQAQRLLTGTSPTDTEVQGIIEEIVRSSLNPGPTRAHLQATVEESHEPQWVVN